MKVVVLAGGGGSRLGGEQSVYPKALAPIGNQPILWHLLSHFAHFGFRDFAIALGDRGDAIKQYFAALHLGGPAVRLNTRDGNWQSLGAQGSSTPSPDWSVDLIETGEATNTAGRVRRMAEVIDDQPFILVWCDGLSDVDPNELVRFHQEQQRMVTMMAVPRPARFGQIDLVDDRVHRFVEKPVGGEGWISAGFFVVEPKLLDEISGDDVDWDRQILPRLAEQNQLAAYRHVGFWQCMDTPMEQEMLTRRFNDGMSDWKTDR